MDTGNWLVIMRMRSSICSPVGLRNLRKIASAHSGSCALHGFAGVVCELGLEDGEGAVDGNGE